VFGFAAATWTTDTDAAVPDAVEPIIIDPAALRARMAGIMILRLMVMIPPWRLRRSAAYYVASPAYEAHLNYLN